jgi:hypothetical protein
VTTNSDVWNAIVALKVLGEQLAVFRQVLEGRDDEALTAIRRWPDTQIAHIALVGSTVAKLCASVRDEREASRHDETTPDGR